MSLVHITPTKHVVKETDASRLFRRLLKFDDIFTCWNAETGQWVLCYWVNRLASIADEIEDLGMAMEEMTPALVDMIVRCWKPVDWKKKKAQILSRERSRLRKQDEELIMEQERWDWLKERTKDKAPIPYGFYPGMTGGR